MIKALKLLHFFTVIMTAVLLPLALAHAVLPEDCHLLSCHQLEVLHKAFLFLLVGLVIFLMIKRSIEKRESNA